MKLRNQIKNLVNDKYNFTEWILKKYNLDNLIVNPNLKRRINKVIIHFN